MYPALLRRRAFQLNLPQPPRRETKGPPPLGLQEDSQGGKRGLEPAETGAPLQECPRIPSSQVHPVVTGARRAVAETEADSAANPVILWKQKK